MFFETKTSKENVFLKKNKPCFFVYIPSYHTISSQLLHFNLKHGFHQQPMSASCWLVENLFILLFAYNINQEYPNVQSYYYSHFSEKLMKKYLAASSGK